MNSKEQMLGLIHNPRSTDLKKKTALRRHGHRHRWGSCVCAPWGEAGVSRKPGGCPRVSAARPAQTPHPRAQGPCLRVGTVTGVGEALPWPCRVGCRGRGSPKHVFQASGAETVWGRAMLQGTDQLSGAAGSHLLSGGHAEGGPGVRD